MQDPAIFQVSRASPAIQFPEHNQQQQECLKCPRCESTNTKFCYYNNYNLSQPRHFCKNCRRYWTKGGALRNIPVGGGSRKSSSGHSQKRPLSPLSGGDSKRAPMAVNRSHDSPATNGLRFPVEPVAVSAGFGSLLGGSDQGGSDSVRVGGDGYWGSSGPGWPDLAIYTPGSTNFQ